MRKQVFGRHLQRDTNERKALFKGLASQLVMHEHIETTEAKAKAVKGMIEKLVTKAKTKEGAHRLSLLQPYLYQPAVIKMIEDIAPRFVERPGGYIRIVKIGQRFSDNSDMVFMEWVEKSKGIVRIPKSTKTEKVTKKVKKEALKSESEKIEKVKATKAKKTVEKTEKKVAKAPATPKGTTSAEGRKAAVKKTVKKETK